MSTKALREQRLKLVADARVIIDAADTEKRALSPDENTEYDAIMADVDGLKARIEREEKLEAEERLFVPDTQREARDRKVEDPTAELRSKAFSKWLSRGATDMTPEEVRALGGFHSEDGQRGVRIAFRPIEEVRAAQTVTTTAGGYIIARDFSNALERAMLFYGGMLSAGTVFDTATGAPLDYPTVNDTSVSGRLLAINTAVTNTAITFATVTFNAYKYSSDSILIPVELMQDSAFNLDQLVGSMLGERLGRILNTHFTTGDASAKPQGVVTGATSGKTGATGQAATVIYDDLVDLVYAVDRAYRQSGAFMMNDASIKVIRKLKDGQGLPIWQAGAPTAGEPDRLLGYPVIVNNDVATMAANAKSILFGDYSRYKIRRVKDVVVIRLNERYADAHQVGFLAFCRFDGQVVDAGTHPIQYYANSAT